MGDRERVTRTVSERQKVGNRRQRAGDGDKQKAHDSTSHHLLPLSSRFTRQYLFCDNGQNSLKHLSCRVTTMFIFLSRGRLRDTAGGRRAPTAAGGTAEQCLRELAASTWPGGYLLAALSRSNRLPQQSARALSPQPFCTHTPRRADSLLSTCTGRLLPTGGGGGGARGGCRPARARPSTALPHSRLNDTSREER